MTESSPAVLRPVRESLAAAGIPGCSIALVRAEGVVWSGAFGWADLRRQRPATPETVYHLFSGTKLFTATAILQLAERGLVSLDDSPTRFLPDLSALSGLTLLDLLSHQSGLKDSLRSFLAVTLPPDGPPTSLDALARYPIRAGAPPRAQVAYRNVNYALLGHIVTIAAGEEYVAYVEREILRPLGSKLAFAVDGAMRDASAIGYVSRWDPMRALLWAIFPEVRGRLYGEAVQGRFELREFNLATPAIGGLIGSVLDYAPFLQSQLGGGVPLLSEGSRARMQAMVARGAAGIESRFGVGLGWKFGQVGGRTILNHEGGGAGFTTELRIYPEAGLGIALAMNAMQMPRTMRLAHRISEALFAGRNELMTSA